METHLDYGLLQRRSKHLGSSTANMDPRAHR